VQNCNSSPFIATDGDNPRPEMFPPYLVTDADVRNRRALRSLEILRGVKNATLEDLQAAAFDTEVYWARQELPKYAQALQELRGVDARAADKVRPYLEHLLAWDGRVTADSTAATLCTAWYELLYGPGYPGEEMRESLADDPAAQLAALVSAAEKLHELHGDWRVPYGAMHRIQRRANVADLIDARFSDTGASLPCVGVHGPMGAAFTEYYSPSVVIPLVISQRRRYALVGTSYLATWEFAPEGVRGASLVPLGVSGNPTSAHYFDQAPLLSERRLKPEYFTKQQVERHAVRSYRPGTKP
jgi:acyl-homoserine-lactone acylase